ncbi:MAG: MaoC/PaaZ C-terminal domain-containing protein [Immundisolibacterales bacterium]|nr:MaoC/PaaZ C-terminal domain-containing protein [Immundisolibacterales bacterium]
MTTREFKIGDVHEEVLVEDLTRTQLVMYSGASGDYNPIHTDELYTREAAGYPGVFAHGMLTMGMTGRAITNLVGAENVRRFGVRFTSQVWPGDTLTAATRVDAVREEGGERLVDFSVTTTNQNGETVLTGTATAIAAG